MSRSAAAFTCLTLTLATPWCPTALAQKEPPPRDAVTTLAARCRQPAALLLADNDTRLLVANRQSGSICVVDTGTLHVLAEHEVGRGLADLATPGDDRQLVAVDQAAGQILLLQRSEDSLSVLDRVAVSPDPVRIAILRDGRSLVAACRWSRKLTFLESARGRSSRGTSALRVTRSVDLPFCPRELLVSRDGSRLIVGDAFGGKLALVDVPARSLLSVRSLPAHNLRGLAFSSDGRTLIMVHQLLDPLAQSTFDDIHWGLLIGNVLRVLQLDAVLDPAADLLRSSTGSSWAMWGRGPLILPAWPSLRTDLSSSRWEE